VEYDLSIIVLRSEDGIEDSGMKRERTACESWENERFDQEVSQS